MKSRGGRSAIRSGRWSMPRRLESWCVVALLGSDDAVAHMICLSVTTATSRPARAGPMAGRGYSTCRCCWPAGRLSVALVLHGDTLLHRDGAAAACCFSWRSGRSRPTCSRIFVRALVAREREAALAGQFDTALNNMPHGLCMFAADGRLAVMNHRFSEMMDLSDDLVHRGAGASDIVSACVSAGSISAASGKMILAEIENSQARDIITDRSRRRPRPVAVMDVPADGRRRRGRAAGRHHRAAQCGSQNHPSGAL